MHLHILTNADICTSKCTHKQYQTYTDKQSCFWKFTNGKNQNVFNTTYTLAATYKYTYIHLNIQINNSRHTHKHSCFWKFPNGKKQTNVIKTTQPYNCRYLQIQTYIYTYKYTHITLLVFLEIREWKERKANSYHKDTVSNKRL